MSAGDPLDAKNQIGREGARTGDLGQDREGGYRVYDPIIELRRRQPNTDPFQMGWDVQRVEIDSSGVLHSRL